MELIHFFLANGMDSFGSWKWYTYHMRQKETYKYPTRVANANNLRLFKTIHRHFVEFKTI